METAITALLVNDSPRVLGKPIGIAHLTGIDAGGKKQYDTLPVYSRGAVTTNSTWRSVNVTVQYFL